MPTLPSPPEAPPGDPSLPTRLARAAAAFFGVVLVSFVFLGGTLQAISLPGGIVATELGLFFAPAVLFARALNLEPLAYLGLRGRLALKVLALVLLAAVANYFFAAGGMGLLDRVIPESWHLVDVEKILGMVHGWRLAVVLFGVVVLAPLCEETAFRGFIQPGLVARLGPVWGIGITAFLFSALHADPVGFLPRFELGILFGWLVRRTGSLWSSILAHAVNNGAAALIFVLTGAEEMTTAAAPGEELGALLAAMALGAVVLLPALAGLARTTRAPASDLPALPRLDPGRPVRLRPESPEALALLGLTLAALGFGVLMLLAALGAGAI